MADNLLDVLINRYLGDTQGSVRGALHETPPAKTSVTDKATPPQTLPDKLGVSFIPLVDSLGPPQYKRTPDSAILWAQNVTQILGNINPADQNDVITRYGNMQSFLLEPRDVVPGFFYTFRYDAKTTDQYDRYPLVLILEKDRTGMFGMNFHYLPLKLRFALFEAMMPLIVPLPVQQMSLIYLTYKSLKRRRLIGKLPTLKRYTFPQIKSRVVCISPIEWAVAMAYPSDMFMNTSRTKVWTESRKNLY